MFNQIDAYSIELYIGEKRSGKTLGMTADTAEDIEQYNVPDIQIYTNYNLNKKYFKNVEIITKNDLIEYQKNKVEFHKCIFLLDELHKWFDSRSFTEHGNKAIGYFFGQMGKRGNVCRGTTHDYHMIDNRGRLYTEKMIYVFKGLLNKKGKWEMITNYNKELSPEENDRLYIQKITIIKKLIKTGYLPEFRYIQLKPTYVKASKYFDYYDTEELI